MEKRYYTKRKKLEYWKFIGMSQKNQIKIVLQLI